MEESKIPLFKKLDRAVFESIDKFKQSPNYSTVQDFYNGMEEEQQKAFKAIILFILISIPILFLSFLWWQNTNIQKDLDLRLAIIKQAKEINAQKSGLREISPQILSMNPIDSESMMTTRVSGLLQSSAIDISKIQIKDFSSTSITTGIMRSEADVSFSNLTTDELMNVFNNMIQQERFKISSVSINRNPDTGFLQGQFHAIHFSAITASVEE